MRPFAHTRTRLSALCGAMGDAPSLLPSPAAARMLRHMFIHSYMSVCLYTYTYQKTRLRINLWIETHIQVCEPSSQPSHLPPAPRRTRNACVLSIHTNERTLARPYTSNSHMYTNKNTLTYVSYHQLHLSATRPTTSSNTPSQGPFDRTHNNCGSYVKEWTATEDDWFEGLKGTGGRWGGFDDSSHLCVTCVYVYTRDLCVRVC